MPVKVWGREKPARSGSTVIYYSERSGRHAFPSVRSLTCLYSPAWRGSGWSKYWRRCREELHLWRFDDDHKIAALRHYVDTAKHIAAWNGEDTTRRSS
jgi:hypothetical protein